MSKIVVKSAVKRKPGYMYFVDGSGNIGEAKMRKGGTKGAKRKSCAPKKKAAKKVARKATPKKSVRKSVKSVAKKTTRKVARKTARKAAAKKRK